MKRIIQHCGLEVQIEMFRFPKLHERIIEVVTQLLFQRLLPTNDMVHSLINIELAYINTKHPDFDGPKIVGTYFKSTDISRLTQKSVETPDVVPKDPKIPLTQPNHSDCGTSQQISTSKEVYRGWQEMEMDGWVMFTPSRQDSTYKQTHRFPEIPTNIGTQKLSDREQFDCELIESLIKSYFLMIRKNIQDQVPKAIMHFLVNHIKKSLQSELVTHLYRHDQFDHLLSESEHITSLRREASHMLKALQKANLFIDEIRDTYI